MSGKLTVKDIKNKLQDDTLDLSLCDLEDVPVKEIVCIFFFLSIFLNKNI